jgi:tellurite resistance protein TerC
MNPPIDSVESFATLPMWIGFIAFIVAMLAIDLFAFGGNKAVKVKPKHALGWVLTWITLALSFAGLMWFYLNETQGAEIAKQKTLEFLTGYLIEQTLSIDNMFVFVMIFTFFGIPAHLQRRVLLWGVIGAIVMRATMILLGVWLINQFSWILYVFGAFLVFTAIKMLIMADHKPDLANNPLLKLIRRFIRVTPSLEGQKFFVKKERIWWATPMFLVLVLIEITDLVFAVDSIPAIFAVTRDPFIVFTSNMFAIMGLRALYFLLADMNDRFHLLKYGLALVLLFIGTKLIIIPWFHVPITWSLLVVVSLVGIAMVASLMLPNPADKKTDPA